MWIRCWGYNSNQIISKSLFKCRKTTFDLLYDSININVELSCMVVCLENDADDEGKS